jgi:hypothetical protein
MKKLIYKLVAVLSIVVLMSTSMYAMAADDVLISTRSVKQVTGTIRVQKADLYATFTITAMCKISGTSVEVLSCSIDCPDRGNCLAVFWNNEPTINDAIDYTRISYSYQMENASTLTVGKVKMEITPNGEGVMSYN